MISLYQPTKAGEALLRSLDLRQEDRLSESVELYRQRVADGEVSPEFLDRYRETLEFATTYRRRGTSDDLTAIIRRAFRIS